jgi:hypothetical protein
MKGHSPIDHSPQLEQLLLNRDFEALSAGEKAMIAEAGMSISEYQHLRATARHARQCLREMPEVLQPDPDILPALRRKVRKRKAGPGERIRRLLLRRVPVYQAAAAALVIGLAVHVIGLRYGNARQEQLSYIMLADTTSSDEIPAGEARPEDSLMTLPALEMQ